MTPPLPQDHGSEAPLAPLTPFQSAVAEVVGRVAPGDVITYREVAEEIGRPGSGQAVANVLRRVGGLPWWRVIPANGRLYRTHAPTQAPLLRADGVDVDDEGRVVPPGSGSGADEGRDE